MVLSRSSKDGLLLILDGAWQDEQQARWVSCRRSFVAVHDRYRNIG